MPNNPLPSSQPSRASGWLVACAVLAGLVSAGLCTALLEAFEAGPGPVAALDANGNPVVRR